MWHSGCHQSLFSRLGWFMLFRLHQKVSSNRSLSFSTQEIKQGSQFWYILFRAGIQDMCLILIVVFLRQTLYVLASKGRVS